MLKSMTGFSKEKITSKLGSLSLEISSINKRFLETKIYLPKEFLSIENEIRKKVEEKIKRGSVFLRFEFFPSKDEIKSFMPNISLLKTLKTNYEKIANELKLKEDITLKFLLDEIKEYKEEKILDVEKNKKPFFDILDKALTNLILMQQKEGQTLQKDIETRILFIQKELRTIKKESPNVKKQFQIKLNKKIEEISKTLDFDKDRILKEVAVFAEKIDITEEIIRLDSHLSSFLSLLKDKESLGRKLEFLLQEILREINTISSKSQSLIISKNIIEIKSEIEKIKEQLQNIE
jgi:uncharacterized protein (TIGR00255 family)